MWRTRVSACVVLLAAVAGPAPAQPASVARAEPPATRPNVGRPGQAIVIGGLWGYLDDRGELAITPKYAWASDFDSRGFAFVIVDGDKPIGSVINAAGETVLAEDVVIQLGDGWFVLNQEDRLVFVIAGVGPQFAMEADEVIGEWWEGLAAVRQNGKWGFVNRRGEFDIKPEFDGVAGFSEGLAAVRVGPDNWGYIDRDGRMVIPPQFLLAGSFFHGVAAVCDAESRDFFIGRDGRPISDRWFRGLDRPHEGLAAAWDREGHRYVRPDGSLAMPMVWRYCGRFRDAVAVVRTMEGTWHLIDPRGNKVCDLPEGELVYGSADSQFILISKDDVTTIVDRRGRIVNQLRNARPTR